MNEVKQLQAELAYYKAKHARCVDAIHRLVAERDKSRQARRTVWLRWVGSMSWIRYKREKATDTRSAKSPKAVLWAKKPAFEQLAVDKFDELLGTTNLNNKQAANEALKQARKAIHAEVGGEEVCSYKTVCKHLTRPEFPAI